MLQGTGSSMLKDGSRKVYVEEPKCRRTFRVSRRLVIDARGFLFCHAQRKSSCALTTRTWKLWHVKRRGVDRDNGMKQRYLIKIAKRAKSSNNVHIYKMKKLIDSYSYRNI
jgi:hypothetical protein